MRWGKPKDTPLPKDGDRRRVTRFLWWPKKLQKEWRWLEAAVIEQRYEEVWFPTPWGVVKPHHWVSKSWVD